MTHAAYKTDIPRRRGRVEYFARRYQLDRVLALGDIDLHYEATDMRTGNTVVIGLLSDELSRDRSRAIAFATEDRERSWGTEYKLENCIERGMVGTVPYRVIAQASELQEE